ncbi:hypothetical protein MXZ84_10620, partial [Streptococcus uberis]
LVQGIVQNIPLIIQYAQQIISNFGSSLQANMPSIINNGIAIITNFNFRYCSIITCSFTNSCTSHYWFY